MALEGVTPGIRAAATRIPLMMISQLLSISMQAILIKKLFRDGAKIAMLQQREAVAECGRALRVSFAGIIWLILTDWVSLSVLFGTGQVIRLVSLEERSGTAIANMSEFVLIWLGFCILAIRTWFRVRELCDSGLPPKF